MDEQRLLGGRYLLKDKVGTGGMATVYRAQDQVLDRTVAVKIMLPQYAGDATFAARFKQEAQAAAGLSSPYIVGVYDWGKDGDTYYIVMEYLRGTDLKSGIRSHGALDPKKVAQIGSQICGALSVAHKHEIIHRDIKPQNIMVLPDGNIKVMDFGIARAKNSHLTQDNNVLGTAHYVSPEQTRGQELGPTSDLYSLGIVMYECATGQVPFDGDDAISVALKQVNELPVPPSQINPNVDRELERIILKCMEKDPANRFQTADELRSVLNAYLAGRPVDVPEPTHIIGSGAGEATTRVMSDQTQAMARPVPGPVGPGQTARSGINPTAAAYESVEPKKDGKGKIAGVIVAVIAIIAIAAFAITSLGGNKAVAVPNVIGMTQAAASKQLEDTGFQVKISQSYSDEVERGKVIDQSPKSGQSKDKGTTVTITVSQGKEPAKTVEVPNLVGKTQSEADAALKAAGLKGSASTEANDAEEGKVFWQGTDAGQKVTEGTTIEYKVSSGPGTTAVPDLTGMSKSEAKAALENAGFGISWTEAYDDNVAEGYVVSWNPDGKQAPDTTITVTISQGPESKVDVDALGLVGMSKSAAATALANSGLRYDTSQTQASSSVPAGYVISYSPSGKQKAGTTISLVISSGSGSINGSGSGSGNGSDTEGGSGSTDDSGDNGSSGNGTGTDTGSGTESGNGATGNGGTSE